MIFYFFLGGSFWLAYFPHGFPLAVFSFQITELRLLIVCAVIIVIQSKLSLIFFLKKESKYTKKCM